MNRLEFMNDKNGMPLARAMVTTNKCFRDNNGVLHDIPSVHPINFYGSHVNSIAKHGKDNCVIFIEGEIEHKYEAEGNLKPSWSYRVIVSYFRVMDKTIELNKP